MQHYAIPHTSRTSGRIGLGCMNFGDAFGDATSDPAQRKALCALIEAAVEEGVNLFDHADVYAGGHSETVFGSALAELPELRGEILLQSKCGIRFVENGSGGRQVVYDFSADHIIWSVEQSLTRLGVDYLDILLLHRPDPLAEPQEVARAFDELKRSGKVCKFGVSNHSAGQLQLLQNEIDQPLIINQLEFSLFHADLLSVGVEVNRQQENYPNTAGLLDYCRMNDIMVQAWGPLGRPVPYSGQQRESGGTSGEEKLEAMAAAKGCSWRALALAWILRHPAGIQPIIGTTNPEHLRDNCVADGIELTREEWYQLLEAAREQPLP